MEDDKLTAYAEDLEAKSSKGRKGLGRGSELRFAGMREALQKEKEEEFSKLSRQEQDKYRLYSRFVLAGWSKNKTIKFDSDGEEESNNSSDEDEKFPTNYGLISHADSKIEKENRKKHAEIARKKKLGLIPATKKSKKDKKSSAREPDTPGPPPGSAEPAESSTSAVTPEDVNQEHGNEAPPSAKDEDEWKRQEAHNALEAVASALVTISDVRDADGAFCGCGAFGEPLL